MKNLKKYYIWLGVLFLLSPQLIAQPVDISSGKERRNVIGLYFGTIEYNINYERNIIKRLKYQTNIRIGFGYWTDLQMEGRPINASIVQMIGKKNSHLELNLGVKYVFDKEGIENVILPDVYAGYRYDKPDGRFIFRTGLSYTSLINIGIGIKL